MSTWASRDYQRRLRERNRANQPLTPEDKYRQEERDRYLKLLDAQIGAANRANDPEMYKKMGALAREQAQMWLSTNRALAGQAHSFRAREAKQQHEQEKAIILENENLEKRRKESDRNSALAGFKQL